MLIIWDYFGVVADDAFWYQAQSIASQRGNSSNLASASNAVNNGKMSWDEFCREVAEDTNIPLSEVRERYDRHNINKDVVLSIKKHKKYAKHVLLSNAAHTHLIPLLSKLGLNALFDDVFVSSLIGYAKPDPRCITHVLRALDYDADEAVLIDDSSANCESALNVGLQAVRYENGININEILDNLIRR